MNVEQIEVGPFASNCYLAWNDDAETLVIDPGADPERILDFIRLQNLRVVAYLLTHGHVDHVSAVAEVHRLHPAPIGMHPLDREWAFASFNQMPPFFPAPEPPTGIERAWADGQEWTDAGFRYRVIATPGHSPGGVCFHFPEQRVLFAGDTIFRGSVGRVDLPGGDARVFAKTLARLRTLPPDTVIYPGHGPVTRLDEEMATNPFLRPGALNNG